MCGDPVRPADLREDPEAYWQLLMSATMAGEPVDVPEVLLIAADPATPSRGQLLWVLREIGAGLDQAGLDRAVLMALLDDEDPLVRSGAVHALGTGPELFAHWDEEPRLSVRLDIVHAVSRLSSDDASEWLRALPVGEPRIRLARAAALGLGPDEFVLGLLADQAVWQDVLWMRFEPWNITRWAVDQVAPADRTALLVALAEAPQRVDVLAKMDEHLTRYRSPAGPFEPVLAAWLGDPEPQVRRQAAGLLGGLRATRHKDAIAALVDDPVAGDAAAWALTRFGGARAGRPEPLLADAEVITTADMTVPVLEKLLALGPAAAPYVDKLPMDGGTSRVQQMDAAKIRVLARHVRWRVTGELADLVPVCLEVLDGIEHGHSRRGMYEAVRALRDAGQRPGWVEAALASDHRFDSAHGWSSFDRDEEIRAHLEAMR